MRYSLIILSQKILLVKCLVKKNKKIREGEKMLSGTGCGLDPTHGIINGKDSRKHFFVAALRKKAHY